MVQVVSLIGSRTRIRNDGAVSGFLIAEAFATIVISVIGLITNSVDGKPFTQALVSFSVQIFSS